MTTYLAVDVLGGETLRAQIVQHDIYLNGVAVKAIIYLPALYQIAQVREAVGMLDGEGRGDAPLRDANSAERDLAEIASGCRRCLERKDVLADSTIRYMLIKE